MAKYVLLAQSNARDGEDDAYNQWYDQHHLPEVCALPGVTGARRLRATPAVAGAPGAAYLAMYELDIDDPVAFLADLRGRIGRGEMTMSNSIERTSSVLWVYEVVA